MPYQPLQHALLVFHGVSLFLVRLDVTIQYLLHSFDLQIPDMLFVEVTTVTEHDLTSCYSALVAIFFLCFSMEVHFRYS